MKCLISSEDGDVVDGGNYSQYHVITNDGFVVTVKMSGQQLQCCSAAAGWCLHCSAPWARLGPVPVVSTAETAQLTRPSPAQCPHSQGDGRGKARYSDVTVLLQ